jgi:hypothetical protein
MEIRPPGAPIDDPFLEAVRRRHPDVDLVALPPDDATEPADPVDDATVARIAELVAEAAGDLWSAVAPGSDAAPTTRVQFADRETDVRAVARVVERTGDGYVVLLRLRHELEQRGWLVQRPPDGLERLVAELDGGRLTATYAEGSGALRLELSSAALPVGVERARELVR